MSLRDLPARAVVSLALTVVGALFWLLSCLAGCATVPVIVHPQPVVADTAWACVGGTGTTPEVQILEQADLTCRNSPGTQMAGFGCGRKGYFMAPSSPCVCQAGEEHGSPIRVARTSPPLDDWRMLIVHEMNHRALLQRTGDEDALHSGPSWVTTVATCNEMIRNGGY